LFGGFGDKHFAEVGTDEGVDDGGFACCYFLEGVFDVAGRVEIRDATDVDLPGVELAGGRSDDYFAGFADGV
jgi:hypothetical protein